MCVVNGISTEWHGVEETDWTVHTRPQTGAPWHAHRQQELLRHPVDPGPDAPAPHSRWLPR